LANFLEISDSIGLYVPEDTQVLRRLFDRHPEPVRSWPPSEVLSLMALAQHHGVPTRLLDWSRHPLKAALFAALGSAANPDKTGNICVWALCVEKLTMVGDLPTPFTVITAPAATNSNLRAQEGVFTLAQHIVPDSSPIDRRSFDDLLRAWIAEHELSSPGPWFHHVTLPQKCADELCFDLALEGINQATLFPDFYGVVKAMRDMVRWYRREGPGESRAGAHLKDFSISYKAEIDPRRLFAPPALRPAGSTMDLPPTPAYRIAKPFTAFSHNLSRFTPPADAGPRLES
jgi:hypothetical protein